HQLIAQMNALAARDRFDQDLRVILRHAVDAVTADGVGGIERMEATGRERGRGANPKGETQNAFHAPLLSVTTLAIRFGTIMTFLILRPSMALRTASSSKTAASTVWAAESLGISISPRRLPST